MVGYFRPCVPESPVMPPAKKARRLLPEKDVTQEPPLQVNEPDIMVGVKDF